MRSDQMAEPSVIPIYSRIQILAMFLFYSRQIHTDDSVSDIFIQRYGSILLHRCILTAEIVHANLLLTNQMPTAKLVLIDQLHRICRLHLGVSPCVFPEDSFQFFHHRLLSFRLAFLRR